MIHPTAIIDPSASLGDRVKVGPYAIIGPDVVIGSDTHINAHAVIHERTIIGDHCLIDSYTVIGSPPQDLAFKGEKSRVRIGNHTQIREFASVSRASGEGEETIIGDHCLLMAYTHVAHNCRLGNHVIMVNFAQIAGFVELEDYVFLSGHCILHQFVKMGRFSFMGGASGSRTDIPPFAMTEGRPAAIRGINKVGLRRRGVALADRTMIKKAYTALFYSNMNYTQAIEQLRANGSLENPYVAELVTFVEQSKRGISRQVFKEERFFDESDQENEHAMALTP